MRQLLLFLALFLTACSTPSIVNVVREAPIEFIVLQLNDVYEIAPLEGGKAGGLARVATIRQELMQENPHVITMLAGDFLSPSFLGTMKFENEAGEREKIAGLQMVETLNVMGLDYATFGNHEFDIKDLSLLEKRLAQSDFKYVVCNAKAVIDGRERAFLQGDGPVPEYLIHEIPAPNGTPLRIGLTGVVLPFNQIDYVKYADVTESFRNTLQKLAPISDLTIAITHQNIDEDEALAAAVPGVPLFVGGHEHAQLSRYVDRTVITKADANAKTVYVHRISHDRASGKTSISSTIRKIDDTIAEETATKVVVDRWLSRAFTVMEDMGFEPKAEVMTIAEPLVCKEALIRTSQTNYGRLTMDAIAAALPGADVYFINSGTMRLDDNLFSVVTEYDILRTYPFGGKLVRIEMPGSALERALETGLRKNFGEGGYFQHKNVDANDLTVNGEMIQSEKTYSVVLPEFVAKGYEANLEFLGDYYNGDSEEMLTVDGKPLRNDIRDIVIWYMGGM